MRYKLYLNDYYDISDKVIEFPLLKESLINEMSDLQYRISFKVDNRTKWCSKDTSNGIFAGNPFNHYFITLRDTKYNKVIYEGYIVQICDQGAQQAEITTSGEIEKINQQLKKSIVNLTFYDLIKQLSIEYGISIDDYSFKNIEKIYNGLFSIVATEDNSLLLVDILKSISEIL